QYLADRLWMDVHEFVGTSTESDYASFVTRVSATVIPNAFDDDILSLQFTGSIPPITPHATRIMFEAPSAFAGGYEPYIIEIMGADPEELVRHVRINQALGVGALASGSTEFASPLASVPVKLIRYTTLTPWHPVKTCTEDPEDPFTVCEDFGRWLRQLWCSVPFRYQQAMVGFPEMTLERIGTPSLWFLAGIGYPLVTPPGYHTAAIIPDGGWYGAKNAFRDSDDGHGAGHFPTEVDGWTNQKDPITNTYNLGEDRDPDNE